MPSRYTLQTLPKPNNPNIEIVEVPAQTYGVIKFSGLAGTEKVAAKTKELQSWMQAQNLTITGKPELARYNPPWTLPFMRRNEIMIAYQPKCFIIKKITPKMMLKKDSKRCLFYWRLNKISCFAHG